MLIAIGPLWTGIFLVLALASFAGAALYVYFSRNRKIAIGLAIAAIGIPFLYLSYFAGTHFRVGINQRALLIDTINQRAIGERESGVQSKPLIGATPLYFPANTKYLYFCELKEGVETAVSAPPFRVPLKVHSTFWLDLSEMSLTDAYLAFGGGWDMFLSSYLTPTCLNMNRSVTASYTPGELEEDRDEWERKYAAQLKELFSSEGEGFGIGLAQDQVIMAWDFANPLDAQAYDQANRASNLITQKNNELEAMDVDSQMVGVRNTIVLSTTNGTVASLTAFSNFMKDQPEEMRPYLMEYLETQLGSEYLRLVEKQEPDSFLPLGTSVSPVYPVGPVAPSAPSVTVK